MTTYKRKNPCHRTIGGRRRFLRAVFLPGASGPGGKDHWRRALETTNGTVNLLKLSGGMGMVGSGGSVCVACVRPLWPCR
jgi:hypothetical protein